MNIYDLIPLILVFFLIQALYYMIDRWEHAEKTFIEHGFLDITQYDKGIDKCKLRTFFKYLFIPAFWALFQISRFIFIYLLSGYIYKIILFNIQVDFIKTKDSKRFNHEFQN